jgi:hypothetical protein
MVCVRAPQPLEFPAEMPSLFLAGSIEQGAAEDWQQRVVEALAPFDAVIFNPRRAEWDATWPQEASFGPFREQVTWELDALSLADVILLVLCNGTKSPISLLELGLHAASGKLVVVCEPDFWRRGNVQIVCQRQEIPMFDSVTPALGVVMSRLDDARKAVAS